MKMPDVLVVIVTKKKTAHVTLVLRWILKISCGMATLRKNLNKWNVTFLLIFEAIIMSIERELLKRVISGDDDGDFFISHRLYKDIETFLAQPEQEPTTRHALDSYWNQEAYQRGYAEAKLKLKRKPLTPQQISEGNQSMLNVTREAFKQGVIFAEKAHGIGVDGE